MGVLVAGAALLGPAVGGGAASGTGPSPTVWLCRPGLPPDPCLAPLSTTAVSASGAEHVLGPTDAKNPPIDCF
jgi:hypothetical protein